MAFRFETTYLELPPDFYSLVNPAPVTKPELLLFNIDLCRGLDLSPDELQSPSGVQSLSGNQIFPNSQPLAQAYCGHQFGHFVRLGDGRAHLLGEHLTKQGERYDVQLKGSGPTPYSRRGDGRAALGPMIREYLISEAMAALGVPTTRSLAVLATGEPVYRETPLPGGLLVRVARSHLRVGTFQWAALYKEDSYRRALLDYTVKRHDPELSSLPTPEKALAFLEAVQLRQASLVSKWMLLGFVHGVMNTDNMSLCGETIDYGPCAFLDEYDPQKVFSSIDHQGRYAFANQGQIAHWNLARLAETLLPLVDADQKIAEQKLMEILNRFPSQLTDHYHRGLSQKLGFEFELFQDQSDFVFEFLNLMKTSKADYTQTFYELTSGKTTTAFWQEPSVQSWLNRWRQLLHQSQADAGQVGSLMKRANPWLIPRNHHVEAAIKAAYEGDLKPCHFLLEGLRQPYEELSSHQDLMKAPTEQERVRATFCGT